MGQHINLSGLKFGKLTAIQYMGVKKRRGYWLCQCECGNKKEIMTSHLTSGRNTSCGCSQNPSYKDSPMWSGCGDISGAFWYSIQREAKRKDRDLNITIKDIWELYQKQNGCCALSGVPIRFPKNRRDVQNKTASLDRIDSTKGYSIDNIQWVHKEVNAIKSNLPQDDFLSWVQKIYHHNKEQKTDRPNWTEYFIGLSFVIASRSRDKETKHGAIITDENNIILGTGYNSFVRNLKDDELPSTRPNKYPFMIHAEENALLNCKIPPREADASIYVTGKPCNGCLQRIIQSGIKNCYMADRRGTALESKETEEIFNMLIHQSKLNLKIVKLDSNWLKNIYQEFA